MCLTCRLRYDREGNEIDLLVYAMTAGAGSDEEAERDFEDLMSNARDMLGRIETRFRVDAAD